MIRWETFLGFFTRRGKLRSGEAVKFSPKNNLGSNVGQEVDKTARYFFEEDDDDDLESK